MRHRAGFLENGLNKLAGDFEGVQGVKGLGMLRGLDLKDSSAAKIPEILKSLQSRGMLALRSGTSVIRLAPPLVITIEEIEQGTSDT